jgi:HlyD family secretion protein
MAVSVRRIVWMLVTVAAVAIAALTLRPRPIEVETAEVVRGALRVTVNEEGETRLRRRFMVSAPVSGRVQRIDLRPGDPVEAGRTVLATIKPALPVPMDARTRATAEARVQAADAAASRARADRQRMTVERDHAAEEAKRARALFESGYGSKETLDAADARFRTAQESVTAGDFAIRTAEFDLAQARAALISGAATPSDRPVVVTSPIRGVVLRRAQESEAVVVAGAPLVEVGDLHDLEIVADLLSADAVRVAPGAAVVVDRWGGDRELAGRVARIEPSGFMKISALGVEEQRVNVVIHFVDPPEARASLGDGFRVEVRIVVWEQSDVVKVPTSALFRFDSRWAAFVVEDGRLVRREVMIGQRDERDAQVVGGLSPGDRVVVYPGESLAEGARIVSK